MSSWIKGSGLAAGVLTALGFALLGGALAQTASQTASPKPLAAATVAERKQMLQQYCSGCHNDRAKVAGLSVDKLDAAHLATDNAAWEAIFRRLKLGEMPPKGMKRPSDAQLADFNHWLVTSL